jgi:DNA-binding MarR family transcriptional regulator
MPNPERATADGELLKTVRLTEKDAREAARLMQLLSGAASELSADPDLLPPVGEGPDRADLLARARIVIKGRRMRGRYFSPAIFGEPAWDILLVLYIADVSGDRQTIGKLAEWIVTPPSTVMRWVGYLERERLVERHAHPTDRRIMFIRLTDKGRSGLDGYLRALPG